MKIRDIVEALPPSYYRDYVNDFRNGNSDPQAALAELFAQSNLHKDRNAYRLIMPYETEREISVPQEIEAYLDENGFKITDYQRGMALDKYGRATKIGKVLKKNQELLNLFNTDESRSGKGETRYAVISRHPSDIIAMSTGQGWTSCMNLDFGMYKDHIPAEVENGSVVAFEFIPKKDISDTVVFRQNGKMVEQPRSKMMVTIDGKNIRGIATGRILLKLFESTVYNGEYMFHRECVYGTPTAIFEDIVTEWAHWANDILTRDSKSGVYKLPYDSYQDSEGIVFNLDNMEPTEEHANELIDYLKNAQNEYEVDHILSEYMDIIMHGDPYKLALMVRRMNIQDEEILEQLEPRILEDRDALEEYVGDVPSFVDDDNGARAIIGFEDETLAHQMLYYGYSGRFLKPLILLAIRDYPNHDTSGDDTIEYSLDILGGFDDFDLEFFKKLAKKLPSDAIDNYLSTYYSLDDLPDEVMDFLKSDPRLLTFYATDMVSSKLDKESENIIAKSPTSATEYASSVYDSFDELPKVLQKSILSDAEASAEYIHLTLFHHKNDPALRIDKRLVKTALPKYEEMLRFLTTRNKNIEDVLVHDGPALADYISKVFMATNEIPYDLIEKLYLIKPKHAGRIAWYLVQNMHKSAKMERFPKHIEEAMLEFLSSSYSQQIDALIKDYFTHIGEVIPEFYDLLSDDGKWFVDFDIKN